MELQTGTLLCIAVADDAKTARRRRRFFPQEVLSQTPQSSTNYQSASSAMPSPVLSTTSISPSSPLYTSNSAPLTLVPRYPSNFPHQWDSNRQLVFQTLRAVFSHGKRQEKRHRFRPSQIQALCGPQGPNIQSQGQEHLKC